MRFLAAIGLIPAVAIVGRYLKRPRALNRGTGIWTFSKEVQRTPSGKELRMDEVYHAYDTQYEQIHTALRWKGMQILNHPNDLFAIMHFLWEERPDVLVELGTNTGAGAVFYAETMVAYNPHAHVITVDVEDYTNGSDSFNTLVTPSPEEIGVSATSSPLWGSTVRHLVGQPDSPQMVKKVRSLVAQFRAKNVFLIEDSLHRKDMVLKNLLAYHHLVGPCGWILVHDTKLEHLYPMLYGDDGPLAARDAFLKSFPDFKVNRAYEYFGYTQHPQGWLRRSGKDCRRLPCPFRSWKLCKSFEEYAAV